MDISLYFMFFGSFLVNMLIVLLVSLTNSVPDIEKTAIIADIM